MELNKVIDHAKDDDKTELKPDVQKDNRIVYQLGRIIIFKDYMLLAATHFDNNQAHLRMKDYIICLLNMWDEICRTYADKPIFIPLIGAGITRFYDTPEKSKAQLLNLMLTTLKMSSVNIVKPISILLTKDTIQEINFNDLKKI